MPLDSVPDVYLHLAESDFDYSATAGDEPGHQAVFGSYKQEGSYPMAMPAVCHGL